MILLQLGILFELGLFQGVELWSSPEFKEKGNNVKCPGTLGESMYVHTVFTTKTRIFWQILPDLIDMNEFKRLDTIKTLHNPYLKLKDSVRTHAFMSGCLKTIV